MWLKVIKKCDCYYLDEVLARYRVRQTSISHDKLRKLIRSHYDLYHIGEQMGVLPSFAITCVNMLFGVLKKLVYVKRPK